MPHGGVELQPVTVVASKGHMELVLGMLTSRKLQMKPFNSAPTETMVIAALSHIAMMTERRWLLMNIIQKTGRLMIATTRVTATRVMEDLVEKVTVNPATTLNSRS